MTTKRKEKHLPLITIYSSSMTPFSVPNTNTQSSPEHIKELFKMASCQLQRPAEQTCNQKTNENSSGHKVPDMAHKAMCTSEHKQSEQRVKTCQTQCQTQTNAQQQVTAKTQTHCTGKVHSHQNGHSEAGCGQHGGHGMAAGLKEKIHEGKKKVKSLFKRKDRNGGSGGGSSSSSESESDDEPCHCPKKD